MTTPLLIFSDSEMLMYGYTSGVKSNIDVYILIVSALKRFWKSMQETAWLFLLVENVSESRKRILLSTS